MKKSALLLFMLFAAAACRTTSDVKQDEKISELKGSLNKIQVDRADSATGMEDLQAELLTVRGQLEELGHRQKRNEENLEKLLLSLDERLRTFEGKVFKRLELLEKANAAKKAKAAKKKSTKKSKKQANADYRNGVAAFEANNFKKASKHLQSFVDTRPVGKKATNAYILLGNSYQKQKKYAEAIDAYQTLRDRYPKSRRVPEVIFNQAESFRRMGDRKTARLFYTEVIDTFPKSLQAKLARKKIKKLKK